MHKATGMAWLVLALRVHVPRSSGFELLKLKAPRLWGIPIRSLEMDVPECRSLKK